MTLGARPLPTRLLHRLLDPQLLWEIEAHGLKPVAVRGYARVDARGESPARSGPALVCRLYPHTPAARLAFIREQQLCAEATVFEDPDDELAWNLKAGMQNALHAAKHLLDATLQ